MNIYYNEILAKGMKVFLNEDPDKDLEVLNIDIEHLILSGASHDKAAWQYNMINRNVCLTQNEARLSNKPLRLVPIVLLLFLLIMILEYFVIIEQ